MRKRMIKIIAFTVLFLLILANPAAAFEGGFYSGQTEEKSVEVSGEIETGFRLFTDDGELEENLKGDLEFLYPGFKHEFKVLVDYQPGAVEEIEFNEVYYKYYGEKYNFTVGKDVVIWGKGDKVHVVDNINAEDLSDFINPEYKERQIGEEMIKIDRYFRGGSANLEFIYTPDFTPNRLAEDPDSRLGNWVVNPFASISSDFSLRKNAAKTKQKREDVVKQAKDAAADEDNQFGLRFTDSRGGTDYGFSYYHGYLRNPSYNIEKFKQKNGFSAALDAANIHYDEVDVFGFELAKVIATVNSRFELAYYRTDDTSGNDPTVRNNKVGWVVGGDRDLPFNNLNFNLQFTGEKILDDDQIKKNIDVDYNQEGDYTTHRAILKLEDSYQNEKIMPELTWIYNLTDKDYSLELAVDYELKQDLLLKFSHKIFVGDADTSFGQFEDNDFSSIGIKYSF